ncbi:MAG: hypothetical protein QXZ68_06595 [Candidatus Bathyarchaeia archaeon]
MSEAAERITNIVQRVAQPFRLQLIRGQKGGYGWKIDVSAGTRDELLYEVDLIDTYLRGRYLEAQTRTGSLQPPAPNPKKGGE